MTLTKDVSHAILAASVGGGDAPWLQKQQQRRRQPPRLRQQQPQRSERQPWRMTVPLRQRRWSGGSSLQTMAHYASGMRQEAAKMMREGVPAQYLASPEEHRQW